MTSEECWYKYYLLAKDYYNKHGNLYIQTTYKTEDGELLGMWIANQRRAYKSKLKIGNPKIKPLTDKQVELLENIEMIWDARLYNYFNKKIDEERKRSIEIRAYKFLKEYAIEIKNEIETLEDIKNINKTFLDTMTKLGNR